MIEKLVKGIIMEARSVNLNNELPCLECGNSEDNELSRNFFGLRVVSCSKCSTESIYPMTIVRAFIYMPFLMGFSAGLWTMYQEGGVEALFSLESAPLLILISGLILSYVFSIVAFSNSNSRREDVQHNKERIQQVEPERGVDRPLDSASINQRKATNKATSRAGLLAPLIIITIAAASLYYLVESKYKTYEDCILENMKGISDKYAAGAIMKACRAKYGD